ncbi:MAG: hypothetical protein AB7F89_05725 [Pirellulaceae bacterium]
MDITIKKVGKRDGQERFVLVNAATRAVITVKDVTEAALRRFFQRRSVSDQEINRCLERARQRYATTTKAAPVNESSDTMGEDDLLFQLGLDEESEVHPSK